MRFWGVPVISDLGPTFVRLFVPKMDNWDKCWIFSVWSEKVRFVPFEDNLTHLRPKSVHSAVIPPWLMRILPSVPPPLVPPAVIPKRSAVGGFRLSLVTCQLFPQLPVHTWQICPQKSLKLTKMGQIKLFRSYFSFFFGASVLDPFSSFLIDDPKCTEI